MNSVKSNFIFQIKLSAISVIWLLLSFSQIVCAQAILTTKSKKAEKFFREAEALLQQRQWHLAAEKFKTATEKDPEFLEAHYQLGELYRKLGIVSTNNEETVPFVKYHFLRVIAIDSTGCTPSVYRVLGEIFFREGNYPLAKKYLTKYTSFGYEPKNYLEKTTKYLEQCEFALVNMQKPVNILPQKLPEIVNNHTKQYFPAVTADNQRLIFTVRDRHGMKEYEDIFISLKENNHWTLPVSISDNINTPDLNEGTAAVSANGKVLVFTACGGKSRNDTDCDLYISFQEGRNWTIPINMGSQVNSTSWDSQPSLSPDGKTLFFSSKRKGGYGEEDIWMARADMNGVWGEPINMGDLINTKGREVAPFIHPSMSTLYFASDAHPGFGSFDLFVSYKDSVNWSIPKNLGYPINTHLEESSVFITSDCKKAYFSAEGKEAKDKDRYFLYEFEVPTVSGCKQNSNYAKGTIYDAETKQPIESDIELIDLKNKKMNSFLKSDKFNGEYLVVLTEGSHYGLFVSKPGYLFKSHTFNFENEMTFDPFTLDVYLQPIKKASLITLNNVFFETGKYLLENKSTSELDKLVDFLNQNPTLKVEISGHTDNVGLKSNNLQLSTKRAESVLDYLVENGIDISRIKYKGYGDSQPIAPNDTELNRKMNRRIECRIL
jgi:OmpA-OmpF porin, OOP family